MQNLNFIVIFIGLYLCFDPSSQDLLELISKKEGVGIKLTFCSNDQSFNKAALLRKGKKRVFFENNFTLWLFNSIPLKVASLKFFERSPIQNIICVFKKELSQVQEAGILHRFNEPEILFNRQKRTVTNFKNTKKKFSNQPRECGINSKSARSVKRRSPSNSRDWPWLTALLRSNSYSSFCGGVLLNRNYILTAAHCVHRFKPSDIIVRLGEYDFYEQNDTVYIDIPPTKLFVHPEYDPATQQHDIALIKLNSAAKYSDFVRPICLPTIKAKTNQTAVVAGWGTLYYGGPLSNVLMEVPIPVWDLESCISKYSQPVFNTNICAASYEGGKDACQGDSGGPLLMQRTDGRWVSIGVVSWGIACGEKDQPGIYTDVASYLRWIFANTKDAIL